MLGENWMSILLAGSLFGVAQPTAGRAAAQRDSKTDIGPSFEAAAIKPSPSLDPPSLGFFPGGRLEAKNLPLRELIREAYGLQGFQIIGGPSWMAVDRFDIAAMAGGDPQGVPGGEPPQVMFLMLRTLLASRFQLVVHNETRILPVYGLVRARRDGKLGPQLRPPAIDCRTFDFDNATASLPDGFACGIRPGPGTMTGRSATIRQLVLSLSPRVGRPVLDHTGLDGIYDLDLTWTPAQTSDNQTSGSAAGDSGVSIFTALREQLGLTLQSQQSPVDVLVVDSARHPAEN